jgi:hypothetical protein
MAELHVKHKRSNLTWLWVLIILVVVAAVIYYLYTNNYLNTGNATGMQWSQVLIYRVC